MALDVSCAFLHAKVVREIYIELPAEDPLAGDGNFLERLRQALYDTRDAPQLWRRELETTLNGLGFKGSCLHPGLFYHEGRNVALVSLVDDLLIGGTPDNLQWVRESLEKKYDIKGTDIDSTKGGLKFLGRRVERRKDGFWWSADPKHRDILLDEWRLANANPVSTPVAAENDLGWIAREKFEEMTHNEATKFRRAAARLNYLALDQPDLGVAAGRLSRCMARPRVSDVQTLKRALRYLKVQPMLGIAFPWQPVPVSWSS